MPTWVKVQAGGNSISRSQAGVVPHMVVRMHARIETIVKCKLRVKRMAGFEANKIVVLRTRAKLAVAPSITRANYIRCARAELRTKLMDGVENSKHIVKKCNFMEKLILLKCMQKVLGKAHQSRISTSSSAILSHFSIGSLKLNAMPSLTPEEIREFGNIDPSTWHDKKHGSGDFCSRAKVFYGGLPGLKNFKWLTANCDAPSSTEVMDRAAANGQCWNLIWFHNNRFEGCTAAAMDGAASNGHFFSLEWLHLNCDEGCTTGAMDGAASNGHLKVVIWLHKNRPEGCTAAAMDGAASNGHLKVVQWLHENRPEGCTTAAMEGAVLNSHVKVARWLNENRTEGCSTAAMDSAAGQGYLGAVKWLKENRSEGCSPAAMINAASKGYLDVVQYLLTNVDQQATNAAISAAAENGHLLVVKYLHENRSEPCEPDAIIRAEQNGHSVVVEFLLEHEDYRLAYEEETSKLLAEGRAALTQKVYHLFWVAFLVFRFIPQMLIEFFLPGKSPARVEMETRIRAEEEASIREKEEPRLRAEVAASIREDRQTKATIQAEEEEEMRARIRAEIQDSVEDKIRAEIRVGLLGDDLKKQI